MDWRTVWTEPHSCNEDVFWEAAQIYNRSPNLINKRLFGAKLFYLGEYEGPELFYEMINTVYQESKDFAHTYFSNKIRYNSTQSDSPTPSDSPTQSDDQALAESDDQGFGPSKLRFKLWIRILLHKREDIDCFELVAFDYREKMAIFIEPVNRKTFFAIQYKENAIDLKEVPKAAVNMDWCKKVLLPKIARWMAANVGGHKSSIALVPIDEYKTLYNQLKAKYTSGLWQIWTEVTNPEKFIHEDLAIATYLLLLWKDKPPQRYVDLGCGNGLLVFILNSESHLGVGYDLRSRKIWEKYPPSTVLKVMKIEPTKDQMFEEVDWIIGNHSDELTPWIPVFATFNSPACNFFLLPCCAYHFDGTKFRRRHSAKSLYRDYLDYVEKICVACGFNVMRDKLRIPSTKRTCFISRGRYHEIERLHEFKQSIDSIIEESSERVENKSGNWNIHVKLRDSEEKVRNCTQIDGTLKQNIVGMITEMLLKGTQGDDYSWNEGKPSSIQEIITSIPSRLLKELKNEGRGLQTLIKNHHHIFKLENGLVKFKKPTPSQVKTEHWKKKPCWFYFNHPNSCPLKDEECSYRHSDPL